MARRYASLTAEEATALSAHRDRCMARVRSTEPADRERVERGVVACYRFAGIAPPQRIVWVDSPAVLLVAAPVAAALLTFRKRGEAVKRNAGGAARFVAERPERDRASRAKHRMRRVYAATARCPRGITPHGRALAAAVDDAIRVAVGDGTPRPRRAVTHDDGASFAGLGLSDAIRIGVHAAFAGPLDDASDDARRTAAFEAPKLNRNHLGWGIARALRPIQDDACCEAVALVPADAVRNAVDEALDGGVRADVERAVSAPVYRFIEGTFGRSAGRVFAAALKDARPSRMDYARRAVFRTIEDAWQHALLVPDPSPYAAYFRDVVGPEKLDVAAGQWDRSRALEDLLSAGWCWPGREFAMVCERPRALHVQKGGTEASETYRLHHAAGPAVAWRDGVALWYLHGVPIHDGATVISGERRDLTVRRILSEENVEVRRELIERYGRRRFLRDAGAIRIDAEHAPDGDAWADPTDVRYRSLWLLDDADFEPIVMIEVVNQTPEPIGTIADGSASLSIAGRVWKRYVLRVPPDMTTCADALAWTFGKWPGAYAPAEES